MRNEQQLDLFKQGVATTWSTWRESTPEQLSQARVGRNNL